FDFGQMTLNQPPADFRTTVSGKGKPGTWTILMDEIAPVEPAKTQPAVINQRAVLGQIAQDPTDDHYPLLMFDGETFGDFKLTTQFRMGWGTADRWGGLASGIKDEKNYYSVGASALGNIFYFLKFVNGQLIGPVGMKREITKGCGMSWGSSVEA